MCLVNIHCKDRTYVNVINVIEKDKVFETTFGYELLDATKDGKYIVIRETECDNPDTLIIGEIKDGKREGIWKYYDKERYSPFPCDNIETLKHNKYKDGLLLSERFLMMTDIETIFEGISSNEDQRWTEKIYRNGKNSYAIESNKDSIIIREEYSLDSILLSKQEFYQDYTKAIQYHENGQKSFEYNYDDFDKIIGTYKAWNEQGEEIQLEGFMKAR